MADAPKILGTDSLRSAYPKLNSAIDNSNEALTKSNSADTKAANAVNTANAAETKADSVQTQFNQVVIDGDSSVEAAQARVDADGNAFTTLKDRLDNGDAQLVEKVHRERKSGTRRPMWTITFDDECDSIYQYMFPICKAEKVPAVFYVVPNRIGTGIAYNYGVATTWDKLREMDQSIEGRIEIHNHTNDHIYVPGRTEAELRSNIENGQALLLTNGIRSRHLAYPGGAMSAFSRNILQDYFETAVSTVNAINKYNIHPYAINRRSTDTVNMTTFKADIDKAVAENGWLISYQHAIDPSGSVTGQSGAMAVKTPAQMTELIQYAKSKGVEIVGIDEGLKVFAPYVYEFNYAIEPIVNIRKKGGFYTNEVLEDSKVVVYDRFNRLDDLANDTLGYAETGQKWEKFSGNWGIESGKARCLTDATIARTYIDSGVSDFECEVDFYLNGGTETFLMLRAKDDMNNIFVRGTTTAYELRTRVANAQSLKGSHAAGVKEGDKIKVVAQGTVITVFLNGAQIISATVSDFVTEKKHGLISNISTLPRWDNFKVSTLN
jgi:peptidoglycan/xylan/chitin deacetylase (PgdA/CDA1 family)